jgi:RNA polymerase sigma factor (sigma-70 family)
MTRIFHLGWTEEKIIAGCKNGDHRAQRQLYEKFGPTMLAVCRRYTRSLEDAEEVLSNAFIKVFDRFETYRGEGSLAGWLRSIMVRESLNFIRYQKNLFVEQDPETLREEATTDHEETEMAEALLAMIDQLPLGYRTVFNLYAIEGYSHKEIAELLGISEGTSKSQLSKARSQLQACIQDQKLIALK